MKLWLLQANKMVGYDSYDAHVIAAETEFEARALAPCGDEGRIWNTEGASCEELLAEDLIPGVIISSFNAG